MQDGQTPFTARSSQPEQHVHQQFPYLGRDTLDRQRTIFNITDALNQLNQAARTNALLRWMGRFDGIEAHLEDDQDPFLCIWAVLQAELKSSDAGKLAVNETQEQAWERIVSAIMRLDFVHTHSSWGTPTKSRLKWNPLEQTWLEFLELGKFGESLTTWMPGSGNPDLARRSAATLITGII